MEYISHLYLPGAVALWCALAFSLAAAWGYAMALWGDTASLPFARRAYDFFALAIGLTCMVLALLLLLRDFRIEYVYQYSGLELPLHYQFSAFWAGQKGSFLIWLFWGALLGVVLKRTAGKAEAPVMGVYILILLGLLLILVRENPFVMLDQAPPDGAGLNPLLQDNWMVIHPPIMFVGYALSAVPFAFAMAALWRRDYDGWATRAFPWALAGFLVLGTAILLGGYWAYKTLGWGGWWGWDPVENASLIPWMFGTVLIHGLYLERTKGRYRRANYVLASLVYLSVLYGTFLTRSGVLADFSVHSFVDLGISGWLLFGMGMFLFISIYLLITRLRQVPTEKNEDPMLSRGMLLVLSTITLLASAVVITIGTSAPLLTKLMPDPGQVGPEFYNRVNFPLALLLALLLALIPAVTWRGESPREILRRLIAPGVFALVAAVGAALWAVTSPFHLLFVFLAALALGTNLTKTAQLVRSGGLWASGGYLAHVGVGVILLGTLASSAYDQSAKVTLEQGVPRKVGGMTLTFERYVPRTAEAKEHMEIRVERAGGDTYTAKPRFFINDRTQQLMANPHIRTLPLQDLYISPIEFDPGQARVELAKGSTGQIGPLEVRFVDFDLNVDGNAMAQMASSQPVTIGADLEVTQGGKTFPVKALYRMNPADGRVETPAVPLPGGGALYMTGINAGTGGIQIEAAGLASRPKLSVDVTRKPLIQMVWGGLWIILIGGAISTSHRYREARRREAGGQLE